MRIRYLNLDSLKVHPDRCYHCGSTDNLQIKPDLLMETYKSVLPLCTDCQDKGLNFFCRMPNKLKNENVVNRVFIESLFSIIQSINK